MALRSARFCLLVLGAIPLVQSSCGGSDDGRKFANPDSGSGGGTTGGTAGTPSGGGAGSPSGGNAGASGTGAVSGSGGTIDGGTPCTNSSECDDGNACNGSETCDSNYCVSGNPVADGTPCTPNLGDAGLGDAGAKEYACTSGLCSPKCDTDADCNDNDLCTGNEICLPTTKTCLSGTPPVCDDNSPCTDNKCDPVGGCFYPLIDADGDQHADKSLGSCGDDCNDDDNSIYTGAAELCDNKDNNCNGQTDELAPTWYIDCDVDSYAPSGAPSVTQCDEPTYVHTSCGASGSWTSKVPAAGTSDCWDKDAKAHPMSATENNTAWQTVPMSGGAPVSMDYDYNCDGQEEKEWTTTNAAYADCSPFGFAGTGGFVGFEPNAAIGGFGGILNKCVGAYGWATGGVPGCGSPGTISECYYLSGTGCTRKQYSLVQPCR